MRWVQLLGESLLSDATRRESARGAMAEFSVACSAPVAGAQTKGVATLAGDVLAWRPSDGNLTGERTAPLHLITGHQRNKAGSKVPSLRLIVGEPMPGQKPNALVLSFPGAETDRDALSDAIKAALTEIMRSRRTRADVDGGENPDGGSDADRAHVTTAAERAAREALLAANRDLADMHGKLVMGSKHRRDGAELSATITDDEFWASRRHLLAGAVAKVGANQRTGIDNSEIAGIQGQRAGDGDKVTATLTHEKMHRIFAERPAVRQAFVDNVLAGKITERDFWTRFLKSEYFKMVRAGAPPQGEEEAADLQLFSRRPAPEVERRARVLALSKSVNLVADAGDYAGQVGTAVASQGAGRVMGTEDDVDGGPQGGHGIARDGAKEPPPPATRAAMVAAAGGAGHAKAAAAKFAAREVLQSLNHHAEVVLRGRPSMAVTDARSAAMAAEEQERAAWARTNTNVSNDGGGGAGGRGGDDDALVQLEDLVEREAPRRMALTLEDRDAYFAAATGGTRDGEGNDGEGGVVERGTISPETVRARARHLVKGIRLVCEQLGFEPTVDGVPVAYPEGTEITDEDRARARDGLKELEGVVKGVVKGGVKGVVKGEPDEASARVVKGEEGDARAGIGKRKRRRGMTRPVANEDALAVLKEMAVANRREIVNAGLGGGGATGWGAAGDLESDACKLDDAVEGALRDDAGMANELLRHFWSAQPMVTPARWDKADRVAKTLEKVYERLEATKRSQTGARRSAAAIRLKPLVQAMDAAFQFFDDEKVKRASAYEAFVKEKAARE